MKVTSETRYFVNVKYMPAYQKPGQDPENLKVYLDLMDTTAKYNPNNVPWTIDVILHCLKDLVKGGEKILAIKIARNSFQDLSLLDAKLLVEQCGED